MSDEDYTRAMSHLASFLSEHWHLPDDYEIWGGSERPIFVVTMGDLRTLLPRYECG